MQCIENVYKRPGKLAESEWVSRVGDQEFGSWSSQTNEVQNWYLLPPSQALGINRIRQGLVISVSG